MTDGSFQFANMNSVDDFGIYVVQHTMVVAPKRIRKTEVPYKHGQYNYGVKAYGEIELSLDCYCEREYTRNGFRSVSAWLAKRSKLYFWDEDDKHYEGEFESFSDFDEFTLLRMNPFTIKFVAFPFALGEPKTDAVYHGTNRLSYAGTAEMPAYLRVKNVSAQTMTGLQISIILREDL